MNVKHYQAAFFQFILITLVATAQPQTGVKELPIYKPVERKASEPVRVKAPSRPIAPSRAFLVVLLDPIVTGQVIVRTASGREVARGEAGEDGQIDFELPRGVAYKVEATSPGYSKVAVTSKPLVGTTPVRLKLNPQSRVLKLRGVPAGSEILVNDRAAARSVAGGVVTLEDLPSSKLTLVVRHPEYNDYRRDLDLSNVSIGEQASLFVALEQVAKLTIESVPEATVLIDGAVQGRVNQNGKLLIEYPLRQTAEHSITVEKTDYRTETRRERLSPGSRTLAFPLERVATAVGISDVFDNLNQWSKPTTWEIISDARRNSQLRVSGTKLGVLKDKTYRDLEAVFTINLTDGKGASWALKTDPEGRDYYLFHLAGPKSTANAPNRFYTFRVLGGGPPVEVSTPTPVVVDLAAPTTFTIEIQIQGHRIEHWISSNDSGEKDSLGVYTDTSATANRMLYGSFGFRSVGGEVFLVDDFSIAPRNETAASGPKR